MATTVLERKALFKAAVTLRELTMAEAAAKLGVSYNHLILVLRGERQGSARLVQEIAEFVGRDARVLFDGLPKGTGQDRRKKTLKTRETTKPATGEGTAET